MKHPHLRAGDHRDLHDAFETPAQDSMKPDRRGKHERMATDNIGNAADSLPQSQFLRSEHRHRFAGKCAVHDAGLDNSRDIFDRVWPDWFIAKANERKYREGVKCMAE